MPQVAATASQNWNNKNWPGDENGNWYVGVSVGLNIFDSGVTTSKIHGAEADLAKAHETYRDTEEEIKEFAEIAKENDIILMHDITYKDFAQEHFLAAKYAPENTVSAFSFSKIFGMAGLRLGAVVSTPDNIDAIRNVIINDVGTNMIAQYGAIAALKSKPDWIGRVKQTTLDNQKIIKECVDEIDGVFLPVYPSSANMMAIDLSGAGIDPEDMSTYLIEKKVFTRQGSYTSKRFGDRYLRVSFSIAPEKVKIFAREFKLAVEALRTK